MASTTYPVMFASQLRSLRADLIDDYPDVDPSAVDSALERATARFSSARVPDFRLVLVEKFVRSELREMWD